MAVTTLLDYSFSRPDPATIVAAGFTGVLRYLSPNVGKNLTIPERDSLRAAGLDIGLVWEWYAQRANEGHDAGVQDAQAALTQANALGYPADLPLFFAVDWDATPAQQTNIDAYFDGVASIIGLARTGIYGGYWPLKRCFDDGKVTFGWQTYAWSGGQWDSRAQLRQTLNGQWSGQVDFDEDEQGTAGLWVASATVQPQPAPAPLPTPVAPAPSTHGYQIKSGDTFWALEAANGWTHGTLQNLNPGVDPTKLAIGQTVQVPGAEATPVVAAPTQSGYQIKSGDTFWGLEAANGWAHGTLQSLNPGLNPSALQIGQTINVPGSNAAPTQHTYGRHTIVSGDTLWGIANANGWTVGALEQINPGINPAALQIGSVINTP